MGNTYSPQEKADLEWSAFLCGEYESRTRGCSRTPIGAIFTIPPNLPLIREASEVTSSAPTLHKSQERHPLSVVLGFGGEYESRTRDLLHAMQAL